MIYCCIEQYDSQSVEEDIVCLIMCIRSRLRVGTEYALVVPIRLLNEPTKYPFYRNRAPHPARGRMMNQAETLDRIYRYQRHLYDATRRFFLLGRDRLLDSMAISAEDRVLEIGCGTGRNLILLAEHYPDASFFGVDASRQMLATATRRIAVRGLAPRISLAVGLAEQLDPKTLFGDPLEFDKIFFSYSLSMMPRWHEAIEAAFDHLKLAGTLHVLDFWDQESWPAPLKRLFTRWLALFQVRFEPDVISTLSGHFTSRGQSLSLSSIANRYAFLASPERSMTHRYIDPA